MNAEYITHKYAEMFPDMAQDEFDELVKDVKQNGLIEPITMLDGKVLDGRSRLKACIKGGVELKFVQFDGRQDPLMFVWAKNFARRNLSLKQRVLLALQFKEMVAAAAKERMSKGGKISAAKLNGRDEPINSPIAEDEKGKTVEKLAEMAHVGRSTMQSAIAVQRDAPELLDDVKAGKLSLNKAAKETKAKKLQGTADKPDAGWKKVVADAAKLNADLSAFQLSGGMPKIGDLDVLREVADRILDFLKGFEKGDGA